MNKGSNSFNINEYLKELEKTFEKQLADLPGDFLQAILERAYRDTHQLFKDNEQNDFKKVTYVIYRSYILGMLMEKLDNKKKDDPRLKPEFQSAPQLKVIK
jgi:hypothetical protein